MTINNTPLIILLAIVLISNRLADTFDRAKQLLEGAINQLSNRKTPDICPVNCGPSEFFPSPSILQLAVSLLAAQGAYA